MLCSTALCTQYLILTLKAIHTVGNGDAEVRACEDYKDMAGIQKQEKNKKQKKPQTFTLGEG